MPEHVYDPSVQASDVAAKLAAAVGRLGDYSRMRHWEAARSAGLTPFQLKILLSLRYRESHEARASDLAAYYGVARPTVSEAIRLLQRKGYLEKRRSPADGRAYDLPLTPAGSTLADALDDPLGSLRRLSASLDEDVRVAAYASLYVLIDRLERAGEIDRQRHCHSCVHRRDRPAGDYCALLRRPLTAATLRIDCPEHERAHG